MGRHRESFADSRDGGRRCRAEHRRLRRGNPGAHRMGGGDRPREWPAGPVFGGRMRVRLSAQPFQGRRRRPVHGDGGGPAPQPAAPLGARLPGRAGCRRGPRCTDPGYGAADHHYHSARQTARPGRMRQRGQFLQEPDGRPGHPRGPARTPSGFAPLSPGGRPLQAGRRLADRTLRLEGAPTWPGRGPRSPGTGAGQPRRGHGAGHPGPGRGRGRVGSGDLRDSAGARGAGGGKRVNRSQRFRPPHFVAGSGRTQRVNAKCQNPNVN
ncbi:hypothetical protein DESC_710099 [Desulfosarcina cetonica]|nr:hypothetical protein DESC_710099 [Desulfosarcina cetonica]